MNHHNIPHAFRAPEEYYAIAAVTFLKTVLMIKLHSLSSSRSPSLVVSFTVSIRTKRTAISCEQRIYFDAWIAHPDFRENGVALVFSARS
jgi:hypothetical protein